MADNEKRVSTGAAQEIPLEPHPQHQYPIASDSSSEYDEVSALWLRYLLHPRPSLRINRTDA